jgi:hypothetical protein
MLFDLEVIRNKNIFTAASVFQRILFKQFIAFPEKLSLNEAIVAFEYF